MLAFPLQAAKCNGVLPFRSAFFTSAPRITNDKTMDKGSTSPCYYDIITRTCKRYVNSLDVRCVCVVCV